jgi:hypothetical protein
MKKVSASPKIRPRNSTGKPNLTTETRRAQREEKIQNSNSSAVDPFGYLEFEFCLNFEF